MSAAPALPIGLLGEAARLAEPRALALLGVVAALAVVAAASLLRRRAVLARAAGRLAPRLAPGAGLARPAARQGLLLLGMALLAVALARPQCGTRTELARRFGVDLVVVLDASRSMLARDVAPDRLGRARLEVGALVDGLAGDRVGVVLFAADPFVLCPLTSDYAAARLFLRAAGPDAIPRQGTDVGAALLAARDVLDAAGRGARSRVVLLVSDGEDNEGGGVRAATALADEGVKVFALGVGTAAGAPIPILDEAGRAAGARKDRAGATIVTRRDDRALRAIVEAGGGEAFEVGAGAAALRAALDRLARSELEGRATVTYEDRYALAAFPAVLALLAAMLLREGRRPAPEARP
jgi:Ca-activated chloride channel family protein